MPLSCVSLAGAGHPAVSQDPKTPRSICSFFAVTLEAMVAFCSDLTHPSAPPSETFETHFLNSKPSVCLFLTGR